MNGSDLHANISRQLKKLDWGQSPQETLDKIRDVLVVYEREANHPFSSTTYTQGDKV